MSERPRRMTQAERTARTRAKVLSTAIDCLYAQGYAATTTSLVAQRSGSRGAMLHQFPTRADLMLAVVEAAFEEEMDLYDARFGAIADPKERVLAIPEAAWPAILGCEVFICDALRRTPHPSHAHLALTLDWMARANCKRGILTNMHIDLDYDTVMAETPEHIVPAHDGMRIELV